MVKVIQAKSATSSNSRWLWVVLLLTIALTVWTALSPQPTEDVEIALAEPKRMPAPSQYENRKATVSALTVPALTIPQDTPTSTSWLEQLKREAPQTRYHNLFTVHSWVVAPPVIKTNNKALPPPTPTAPPAPFTYMGKLEDGPEGSKLFLIANNRVYAVSIGELINPFWRLDGEDENNVQLTFLPLQLPQLLSKTKQNTRPIAAESSALDSR